MHVPKKKNPQNMSGFRFVQFPLRKSKRKVSRVTVSILNGFPIFCPKLIAKAGEKFLDVPSFGPLPYNV